MEATTTQLTCCPGCLAIDRIHFYESFNGALVTRCGACDWRHVALIAKPSLRDRLRQAVQRLTDQNIAAMF